MRVFLFMILIITCGSCAFFRYHSSLVSKPDRRIRNVAVLIFVDPNQTELLTDRPRFGATRAVAEQLADLGAFNFKILERNIPLFKINNMQDNNIAFELRETYDAYITIVAKNRLTDKVTLEMRQTNSKGTLLIEARHAVFGENTEEAVRGTMDLFAKEWKAIQ